MHEMAFTRNAVDVVLKEAESKNATEVTAVYLTIGYVRDIVEDLFEGLFKHLARGTVAEHAEIVINRVPLTVKCNDCGEIYHIDVFDESTWPCVNCGVKSYKIYTGMEFFISRIDIVSKDSLKPAIAQRKWRTAERNL